MWIDINDFLFFWSTGQTVVFIHLYNQLQCRKTIWFITNKVLQPQLPEFSVRMVAMCLINSVNRQILSELVEDLSLNSQCLN